MKWECMVTGLIVATACTGLARAEYNKMMVVGNSLTHHSPASGADGLSWDGDWGMAASCEPNDYVHVLQGRLQGDQPTTPLALEIGHIADERYTMTGVAHGSMNLSGAPTLTASNADLMVFQLGENYVGTLDWSTFGQNYKTTIQQIAAGGSTPKLVVVGPWWDAVTTYKSMLIQRVAYEVGATYVRIDDVSKVPANLAMNEPYAAPAWATNGVGGHPGDTGMAVLADRIYNAIAAPTPSVRTPAGPNLLSNGGFEAVPVPPETAMPTSSVDMQGWAVEGTNPQVANVAGVFDRTGENFLATTNTFILSQVAQQITGETKYTFLIDYGYSVHWYALADNAFAAIAEFDADGQWIRDLARTEVLTANQSGLANQVVLEVATGPQVVAGHRVGVRFGIDTVPSGGCGVLWDNASLTAAPVPEPATMTLLAAAAAGACAVRRVSRRADR
jgi:hypothetical protein